MPVTENCRLFERIVNKYFPPFSEDKQPVIFRIEGKYGWGNGPMYSFDDPSLTNYFGEEDLKKYVREGSLFNLKVRGGIVRIIKESEREAGKELKKVNKKLSDFEDKQKLILKERFLDKKKYNDTVVTFEKANIEQENRSPIYAINALYWDFMQSRTVNQKLEPYLGFFKSAEERFKIPTVCFAIADRSRFYGIVATFAKDPQGNPVL
jgi:hypothetical protein